MRWNMEVSDDYMTEFDAPDQTEAMKVARDKAKSHGGEVFLYSGPIRSGVRPIAGFGPTGRRVL